jgi:diacylglycerol kinase family enzyme
MDVDIMKITEGHRVCYGQLFGLGFDAEVLKLRDSRTAPGRGRTVVPGLLNYVRSTIAALVKLEIPPAEAVKRYVLELTDGVEIRERKRNKGEPPFRSLRLETNAPMIEICKRSFYGNRFRICPDALPGNGFLEVKIFDFEKKPPVLINILPLWMGWHRWINRKKRTDGGSRILHYRARHVSISSSEPFEFHVDGELKTTLQTGSSGGRVEITVLPGALSFLAGACAVEQ